MSRNPLPSLQKFQLGYSVKRNYPWPYTTLITTIFFMGLTVFFILINIPLTAYEIATVDSSNPNSTQLENPPRFSNLLPSALRPHPGDFTPQTVHLGDTISTNMSIFNYHVTEITRNNQPQVSFSWSNNPLDNCNVHLLSLILRVHEGGVGIASSNLTATVDCWGASLFRLSVQFNELGMDVPKLALTRQSALPSLIRTLLAASLVDLDHTWDTGGRPTFFDTTYAKRPTTISNISLAASPCCQCSLGGIYNETYKFDLPDGYLVTDGYGIGEAFNDPQTNYFSSRPPCGNAVPAKLSAVQMYVESDEMKMPMTIRSNGLPDDSGSLNFFSNASLLNVSAETNRAFHNIFQLFYHAIHTDLGVYTANNIFLNQDIFSKSFLVGGEKWQFPYMKSWRPSDPLVWNSWPLNSNFSNLDPTPSQMSMTFMMQMWNELNNGTENSDLSRQELTTWMKVPRLSYTTPIFRMKSSASAATGIFVASFAMISASWKAWNLILTLLAGIQEEATEEGGCTACNCPRCSKIFSRVSVSDRSPEIAKDPDDRNIIYYPVRDGFGSSSTSSTEGARKRTFYGYSLTGSPADERVPLRIENDKNSP